jgi:hypothetical protein
LPLAWLIVVVFAATYAVTAAIYLAVRRIAVGDRASAIGAVSPGMLPPLGIIFALVVAFLSANVWENADRAELAVDQEASALRDVLILAQTFPGTPEQQLQDLVRRHIDEAVDVEWPAMERRDATLTAVSVGLSEAVGVAVGLQPRTDGERVAQRELVTSLNDALAGRRQRVIVSESSVDALKWTGVVILGVLTPVAIACVHSANRTTAKIALGMFATAIAVSLVLIGSHDRPFSGPFSVEPELLEQVRPEPG